MHPLPQPRTAPQHARAARAPANQRRATMSTNTEIVEEVYAAFHRKDLVAHSRARRARGGDLPDGAPSLGRTVRGGGGLLSFLGRLSEWVDSEVQTEAIFEAGDDVVQVGRTRGRVRAGGEPFDVREVHLWRLSEGEVFAFDSYVDTPAMLAALEPGLTASAGQRAEALQPRQRLREPPPPEAEAEVVARRSRSGCPAAGARPRAPRARPRSRRSGRRRGGGGRPTLPARGRTQSKTPSQRAKKASRSGEVARDDVEAAREHRAPGRAARSAPGSRWGRWRRWWCSP